MNAKTTNFRAVISVLIISIMTTGSVIAQPGGQQGPPALPSNRGIKKIVKQLDKELELSEEQSIRVSDIYFAHFDKVDANMKSGQRPDRSEMEALDSYLEKQVNEVLDQDQKKRYVTWLKKQERNRENQRPQGGQRPPGGQGPQR